MMAVQYFRPLFLCALVLCCSAFASVVQAAEVTTESLGSLEISDVRSTNAAVVARNRAMLATQLSGRIAILNVDTGDQVKSGDILLSLDPTLFNLAIQRAQANLGAAKAELRQLQARLNRTEVLAERNYASANELDELTAQVAVLDERRKQRSVDLTEARESLELTHLRAPYDGIVEARTAQVGGYALQGTGLITLTEIEGREVSANLLPRDVKSLKSSSQIFFETPDGERLALTLARVADVLDPVSRQQTVRLNFSEAVTTIGLSGRLVWHSVEGLLPSGLLVRRGDQLGVFVAIDKRATFVALPGATEGQPSTHQLAADSQIVVNGRLRINDGDEISVQNP